MHIKTWVAKYLADMVASVAVINIVSDVLLQTLDIIILGVVIAVANTIIYLFIKQLKKGTLFIIAKLKKVVPKEHHNHLDKIEKSIIKSLTDLKKDAKVHVKKEVTEHYDSRGIESKVKRDADRKSKP